MIHSDLIVHGTPWEIYKLNGRDIHVKREDLCCEQAHFSKLRGVSTHLRTIPQSTIGVLDTRHSKAGWGVTYLAGASGKKTVVYYPVFKHLRGLRTSQIQAKNLGAELVGLPAGRSFILYNQAKVHLRENFPDSYMMPNALKLEESVYETGDEVLSYTDRELFRDSIWIVSISSGTIGAGVIAALAQAESNATVILHCGYSRTKRSVVHYIQHYTGFGNLDVRVIDDGYQYAEAVICKCPFPCNPYYDLKAWGWLSKNIHKMNRCKHIVFWNIGE
jgi:1-aminocyclopropane-1-carboxylate deaminase/D-cysteine desulfhydrase-like pyridoxal-dependent ACC family enzyme